MKISHILFVSMILLFFLSGCGNKTELVAPNALSEKDALSNKKEQVDKSSLTSEKQGILLD